MYQTQWGLAKPPFPSGLDAGLFYEGVNQREALARLQFLTEHRRRLGLMLGQAGLGKSLLLQLFANECAQQGKAVAQIDLLGLSTREFLWQLGSELHAVVRIEDEPLRLFRQLTDRLSENAIQDQQTVVLLDNIDQAGPDVQNQLLRLIRMESDVVTFVLAADESHSTRLGEALLGLVDLRIDLEPWDELDTIGYLQLALVEAGSERPLFTDEALSELHRLAEGNPRRINRLANQALMLGSKHGLECVDADTVQATAELASLPSQG